MTTKNHSKRNPICLVFQCSHARIISPVAFRLRFRANSLDICGDKPNHLIISSFDLNTLGIVTAGH